MDTKVGVVTHYYSHLGVAGIRIESVGLKIGDVIRIMGHTTDLTQTVYSMQLEHEPITEAKPGQDIGLRVAEHVREHDEVFKVQSD